MSSIDDSVLIDLLSSEQKKKLAAKVAAKIEDSIAKADLVKDVEEWMGEAVSEVLSNLMLDDDMIHNAMRDHILSLITPKKE